MEKIIQDSALKLKIFNLCCDILDLDMKNEYLLTENNKTDLPITNKSFKFYDAGS